MFSRLTQWYRNTAAASKTSVSISETGAPLRNHAEWVLNSEFYVSVSLMSNSHAAQLNVVGDDPVG